MSEENELSRAVVWVAQYAPHMSVYIPIFVGAGDEAVPKPLSTGSLWRMDHESTFWRACSVGNWAAHFFKYAIVDVRQVQEALEDAIFEKLVSGFMCTFVCLCVYSYSLSLSFTHTLTHSLTTLTSLTSPLTLLY